MKIDLTATKREYDPVKEWKRIVLDYEYKYMGCCVLVGFSLALNLVLSLILLLS